MTRKKGENYKWEPENIDYLTTAWARGDSAYCMSRVLECHATTVIKKAAALGLERRARGIYFRNTIGPTQAERQRLHDPERRKAELANIIRTTFAPSFEVKEAFELCCTWIIEPGKPTIYCDEVVVRGKPYCPDHCAVAFRKPSAWEEKILTLKV